MQQLVRFQQFLTQDTIADIYFIRHAESEDNIIMQKKMDTYSAQVINEPNITEKGKLQVESLFYFLEQNKIYPDKLICSPQTRALQTSKTLSDLYFKKNNNGKSVSVLVSPEVSEVSKTYHQGKIYPGNTSTFIKQNFPNFELSSEITEQGWNFDQKPENYKQAQQRAKDFIQNLNKQILEDYKKTGKKQRIFIISHNFYIDAIIGILFGREKEQNIIVPQQNTSFSCFRVSNDLSYSTIVINQSYHLSNSFIQDNNSISLEFKQKVQQQKGLTYQTIPKL